MNYIITSINIYIFTIISASAQMAEFPKAPRLAKAAKAFRLPTVVKENDYLNAFICLALLSIITLSVGLGVKSYRKDKLIKAQEAKHLERTKEHFEKVERQNEQIITLLSQLSEK